MQLRVPKIVLERIAVDLRRARRQEIGGLLFGEHLGGEQFRLVDVSIQTTGGTEAHFVRDPEKHKADLETFFAKTGHDYTRFNYLGEWHSHPSFSPLPSADDVTTMHSIVADPAIGANFAVLMIVRLGHGGSMQLSATGFRTGNEISSVDVEID